MALSLNRQSITLAEPNGTSSYDGGCVPFNHPLKQEALSMAKKVVDSFSGLLGYVGVDLVLAKNGPYVVDVNPRLTTSYVGLSKVANFNVAESITNSVIKGQLPSKYENRGFACFSKVETPTPSTINFQKTSQSSNIISPPFPLDEKTKSCSLVIGKGENLDKARRDLEEAKKNLLNNIT
jgi:predicted ATP-grasp superfamily ATP-dependent carboligase